MHVVAISGSLQRASSNHALLERAAALAPDGVRVTLYEGVRDLPHFDLDLAEGDLPASVVTHRATLGAADALLIACPEYGHSLPGALKNAIDWVFPTGELYQKPVAIMASVRQPERGWRGLRALRQTLLALDARVVGGAPILAGDGEEPALRALLADLLAAASGAHMEAAASVALPADLAALIAMTSLEGCVRVPVADGGAAGSLRAAAAEVLGGEIARTIATLPRGELGDILRRVEAGLPGAPELGDHLLPALLAPLDGTPDLESTLAALGPRALAALGLAD